MLFHRVLRYPLQPFSIHHEGCYLLDYVRLRLGLLSQFTAVITDVT
jgi:hypothetical protein